MVRLLLQLSKLRDVLGKSASSLVLNQKVRHSLAKLVFDSTDDIFLGGVVHNIVIEDLLLIEGELLFSGTLDVDRGAWICHHLSHERQHLVSEVEEWNVKSAHY